jgi:glycosyltransferase involved in cell wall biosynthesis
MNKKRKILIVTNSLHNGGAQRVAVRLANALAENNDVLFLPFSTEQAYTLTENVRFLDWGVGRMRKTGFFGPITILISKVWGVCYFSYIRLREKPEVTLSFLRKPDILNIFALGGGMKVLTERNNPLGKGEEYFKSSCRAFRKADKVVFQSNAIMNMFPETIRKKGVVIPNPVEATCKASPSSKRIVTVGRLHPQKNHELLIRSFAMFLNSHPDYTLHIYGNGDMAGVMDDYIKSLSLDGKVFLEGFKKDVHKAIADAEMFVMSSNHEGMPNALLEAMMMGLPCITTSFEGADEFFSGTGSCIMVPLRDEVALADAMSKLADDEVFRTSLAARGEEYARKYSFENIIPLWEKALWG